MEYIKGEFYRCNNMYTSMNNVSLVGEFMYKGKFVIPYCRGEEQDIFVFKIVMSNDSKYEVGSIRRFTEDVNWVIL